MCGLVGYFDAHPSYESQSVIEGMMTALHHRGPDDAGRWWDAAHELVLGHRRLSILDLSAEGHQPMTSASGRFVLSYNGEIYNFAELRAELAARGHSFRGHCDTEVMLAAFEEWGVEEALKKFVGMFAFALWDATQAALYLARDRIGEKPLYYGWCRGAFFFGSELKALGRHPSFRPEINRDALALYLRHNYIPQPYSIFQGIYKLTPGCMLRLPRAALAAGAASFSPAPEDGNSTLKPKRYWSAKQAAEEGSRHPFSGDDRSAVDELEKALKDAISKQVIADVPLGAFLSGGIDSSTVVALMQSLSSQAVRTFSIGFEEGEYNEAQHAKRVARHLGTAHTELYVTPREAQEVIPLLPTLYDEPFSDSSQIPTFLVSRIARSGVTVSLSGDGGDELFGGYERYLWTARAWNCLRWLPSWGRDVAAGSLRLASPRAWDGLWRTMNPVLPHSWRFRDAGQKAQRLAEVLQARSVGDLYFQLVSHWRSPAKVVFGSKEPPTVLTQPGLWPVGLDHQQRMMFLDLVSYLPDDIMVKVDRASMGVSLESRAPFLDHRIVEFVLRLPLRFKIRNGETKWVLRRLLERYLPRPLFERPKMGFGVPVDLWLRGALRGWAEELLAEKRLQSEGFFDPAPIRQIWQEHLLGRRDWSAYLWDILMFQAWWEERAG